MDCPQKQKSAHYKRDKLMDKKSPTNQVSPRLVALNNYEPKTAHFLQQSLRATLRALFNYELIISQCLSLSLLGFLALYLHNTGLLKNYPNLTILVTLAISLSAAWQVLVSSASSLLLPGFTVLLSIVGLWLNHHSSMPLPIPDSLFKYAFSLGAFGVSLSLVFVRKQSA